MLGAREIALKNDLLMLRKKVNKLVQKLNRVLKSKGGKLATGEIEKECLVELEKMKRIIEIIMERHKEASIWY
ncbi:MAG: hypothetical protein COX43_04305 [Parcubacteria group bacterium CG23_combo_of_CG06-09_8_20_14_all_35_9]|nr:MAG: hypothetical protein COX43_04305 [Parcubacteria group bacterium CG23_combo_of_CG06-09_8_20_14_all_35_9]